MNRSKNNTITDSNMPKKNIAAFVRKSVKLEAQKKSPIFESSLDKENHWLKKPNDSWDY